MVPENSLEMIQSNQQNDNKVAVAQGSADVFFSKRRNMRSSMSYMANQIQEQEERANSQAKASMRQKARASNVPAVVAP